MLIYLTKMDIRFLKSLRNFIFQNFADVNFFFIFTFEMDWKRPNVKKELPFQVLNNPYLECGKQEKTKKTKKI